MYYFAYGIHLNKKQMKELCPGARALFTATLPNYRLVFAGWSRQHRSALATIRPFRGEKVVGGIYEISEIDARKLDQIEGVPNNCIRINVIVFDDSHRPVEAFTYVRTAQETEGRPSEEYLRLIREGYLDWGLI